MRELFKAMSLLGVFLLWVGSGCSSPSTSTGKTGSETNWLRTCTSDADCGALSCLCGVCSKGCASDAECADMPGASGCAQTGSVGHAEQCASAPDTAPMCLPATCDAEHLCPPGQLCFSGFCTDTALTRATFEAFGSACRPDDETLATFSGFAVTETNVESIAPECGHGTCVLRNFQGRLSCPYGQTEAELALPSDDPARCRVPDLDGNITATAVTVPVEPQLVDRLPEVAAYCTCRCAGEEPPEEGVPPSGLCACPEGTECRPLVERIIDAGPVGGSRICVKIGTDYDQTRPATVTCDKNGTDPSTDCGNGRQNP